MARRLARQGGRPARGRRAVVLVAAICAMASSGTALAAGPARTPSAEHLRKTYPLETAPPKIRPVPTAPARPASSRKPAKAAKKNGGNLMSHPFLVVLLLLVAVLVWGFVLEVWHILRREPPDAADGASEAAAPEPRSERTPSLAILRTGAADRPAPSPSPPPPPSAAATPQPDERVQQGSDRRPPRPSRRFEPRNGAPAGAPPDAARDWTAEIAWRNVDGGPRFLVCARTGDAPEVVVLSSDAIEWPPRGDDAVTGLEQVVRGLKAQLLGAGWTTAEAGEAWYAERFAWTPRDPLPDRVVTSSSRAGTAATRVAPDRPGISSG